VSDRIRTLLAVSLLCNVFAVGAIAGGLVMLSHPALWHRARIAPRPMIAAGAALPPPDRRSFRRAIQATLAANRGLLRAARDNRGLAARLFVQPHFDEAAVAAALGRARDADLLVRERLEQAALDVAAALPPDERALLARGLEQGGPLRHPRASR